MSDVMKDMSIVGKLAREVVAKRVAIVAVITILLQLAISYHIITPEISGEVTKHITDGLDALAVIVGIFVVRQGVTPKNDPQNDAGEPLIPVSAVKGGSANVEEPHPVPDEVAYVEPAPLTGDPADDPEVW